VIVNYLTTRLTVVMTKLNLNAIRIYVNALSGLHMKSSWIIDTSGM
jgi:hypothetical protein